ncbi:MAG TPA: response regulator [Hymenobacter sp.]
MNNPAPIKSQSFSTASAIAGSAGSAPETRPTEPALPPESTVSEAKAPALIYVLENDRITSVVTAMIVQRSLHGGQVRCFANGQLAFDQLTAALRDGEALPDLILLDLDMPFMDGWEFLEALSGLVPPVPTRVFVLTSSIHPDDLTKATNYPQVKGFFTKPLGEASLMRMRQLLREGQSLGLA